MLFLFRQNTVSLLLIYGSTTNEIQSYLQALYLLTNSSLQVTILLPQGTCYDAILRLTYPIADMLILLAALAWSSDTVLVVDSHGERLLCTLCSCTVRRVPPPPHFWYTGLV